MSKPDDIRMVSTKDIHPHPELNPKHDETFMLLVEKALKVEVPVYFAAIPLALCVPFDLDYRPDLHPIGQQGIQQKLEQGNTTGLSPMIVYPRGAWFVVSDHYFELFAAVRGNPQYVPCWVMGKPDAEYAQDIQGPLDAQEVRKVFGLS